MKQEKFSEETIREILDFDIVFIGNNECFYGREQFISLLKKKGWVKGYVKENISKSKRGKKKKG